MRGGGGSLVYRREGEIPYLLAVEAPWGVGEGLHLCVSVGEGLHLCVSVGEELHLCVSVGEGLHLPRSRGRVNVLSRYD